MPVRAHVCERALCLKCLIYDKRLVAIVCLVELNLTIFVQDFLHLGDHLLIVLMVVSGSLELLNRLHFELVDHFGLLTARLSCLACHLSTFLSLYFISLNDAHALLVETADAQTRPGQLALR